METVRRGLLTLIRSAVTGEACALPEDFCLEDAYQDACDGQVLTLVYEGALVSGMDKNLSAMQKLRQNYYSAFMKSEKQMQMLHRIYAVFEEQGIDYMPLKGSVLKELYPSPELRVMGDADVLIRMEQYAAIKPLMEQMAFRPISETDHELVWYSPELYLELHKRIVPARDKDFYQYFGNGWKLAKLQQGHRYMLPDEDLYVYLFTHFAKHYRTGGIGCRHVVDLWVFRRAHPDMDEAYIGCKLEELKLSEFYQNIKRMIAAWFEDGAEDEKTTYLTGVFFKGAYFGTGEEHMVASGAINAKKMKSEKLGKLLRIFRGLFPGYLYMSKKYPVLKKCAVLLPVFWIWRWITGVLFRRENLQKMHDELRLINGDNIKAYRKELEYVGLDFHFGE